MVKNEIYNGTAYCGDFSKDLQDGVVGVDTVENCNENNNFTSLAMIQQHT